MKDDDGDVEINQGAKDKAQTSQDTSGRFVVSAEAVPMPIVFTDANVADNPIIFANDAFLEMTGYTRDEVLGQSINFQIADGSDPDVLSRIRQEFQEPSGNNLEVLCRRKDVSEFYATLIISPVKNAVGKITEFFVSFIDITQHRQSLTQTQMLVSELKQSQNEVNVLTQQMSDTFESIRDAFLKVDRSWRIDMINSKGAQLLGFSASELVGKIIWDMFKVKDGDTFKSYWDNYHHAMASGAPVQFTEWSDTLSKWFNISVFPSSSGLSIYFYDATDTVDQELQLRLLETAVSRMNDVVIVTDASTPKKAVDAPIVFVNDAFVDSTGYSRAEAIGKTPRILQGPKTQRDELDRVREAISNEDSVKAEIINYTKSGKEFWNEVVLTPICDDAANLTHYVAIQRDISDRRDADAESRLNLERFRLAAQATTDVIWDWDIINDSIWWSGAMEDVYKLPKQRNDTESGDLWQEALHPDDRERIPASLLHVVNSKETRWEGEYRFIRGDGSVAEVMDRGFVIRDDEGKGVRVIGSMTDLSRQRDLESRLRQSQRLEAVGQLTGGIAHDFNNLLTVILGNAEVLSESLTDRPELKNLAEMTMAAAERGSGLTRRLLTFASQQSLEPKAVEVNRLIRGMEGMLSQTVVANINVNYDLGTDVWTVLVDPSQLENAILNLVINSRDALPNGGNISITTSNVTANDYDDHRLDGLTSTEFAKISISDDGAGMPPEDVQRAFDPFFTTKEIEKGSGLGLSMVYGFSRQSGGSTVLQSALDAGTTVTLYLPRTTVAVENAEARSIPGNVVNGSAHILLVEDDVMVMEYAIAQLQSLGYRVTTAVDGDVALDLLNELDDVDLLFSDIMMPGRLDGYDLAVEAQKQQPGLKILLTSGYNESHSSDDIGALGNIPVLNKPYRRHELAIRIMAALELH